jgi:tRNA (guanine37-N1)-methyltransferase
MPRVPTGRTMRRHSSGTRSTFGYDLTLHACYIQVPRLEHHTSNSFIQPRRFIFRQAFPGTMAPTHTIDRSQFHKQVTVPAVRLACTKVGEAMKGSETQKFVWASKGRKSVYPCPEDPSKFRILLLKEAFPIDLFVDTLGGTLTEYRVTYEYEDVNTEDALEVLLPDMTDRPTSFETIGHIAHMNLREEFLPFKHIIGQVVIDKNTHIDVVVNKVGTLEGEFRTFNMEIIGQRISPNPPSLITTVSEQKMKLLIDFEHVYWNSRLSTERARLLGLFSATDPTASRLIDMCCGVGALACFAARAGLEVYANDLNPTAVDCVRQNAITNHVDVHAFNMDAREFVRKLVKDDILSDSSKTNHVMINLPEIGIEFVDVFKGLLPPEELNIPKIHVYCHCFSKSNPPTADVMNRLQTAIGDIPPEDVHIIHVRDVAPKKIMYSVEFVVRERILKGESSTKRARINS